MDETPGPDLAPAPPLDARRRRLLFRATHRGTKEVDILLGGYVSARLAGLPEADLAPLEAILELPDPALADWLTGRAALPPDAPPMLRAMRAAALKERLLF
jgi:antitoxin CptB